jgi:hypothetical protein
MGYEGELGIGMGRMDVGDGEVKHTMFCDDTDT